MKRTWHYMQAAGSKGRFAVVLLPALLAAAWVGIDQSPAFATAEEGTDAFTSSFSSLSDPSRFVDGLDVVLPGPVVPMTRADAVSFELRRRSKTMTNNEVVQVATALSEEAAVLGYDPLLFVALIRIESNFNHLAVSAVGAEGLMQLMPPTAAWMAERSKEEWPEGHSFDPVLNVRLGSRYLGHLMRQFQGKLELALTAYNRGPSATRYLVRTHGKLPEEIREFYAAKVMEKYRDLRGRYGHLPLS